MTSYRRLAVALVLLAPITVLAAFGLRDHQPNRRVMIRFERDLGEARSQAAASGRPVRVDLRTADATLLRGPDWIELLPTGEIRFAPGFTRGRNGDAGFDRDPTPPWGDYGFALKGGGELWIRLDIARGRLDRHAFLAP
jgi:hypothetical protein